MCLTISLSYLNLYCCKNFDIFYFYICIQNNLNNSQFETMINNKVIWFDLKFFYFSKWFWKSHGCCKIRRWFKQSGKMWKKETWETASLSFNCWIFIYILKFLNVFLYFSAILKCLTLPKNHCLIQLFNIQYVFMLSI